MFLPTAGMLLIPHPAAAHLFGSDPLPLAIAKLKQGIIWLKASPPSDKRQWLCLGGDMPSHAQAVLVVRGSALKVGVHVEIHQDIRHEGQERGRWRGGDLNRIGLGL